MKPTKSILILLSLFLIFSCEKENSVEPLVCGEGTTKLNGECIIECDDGLVNTVGECCEEGVTVCYYQGHCIDSWGEQDCDD